MRDNYVGRKEIIPKKRGEKNPTTTKSEGSRKKKDRLATRRNGCKEVSNAGSRGLTGRSITRRITSGRTRRYRHSRRLGKPGGKSVRRAVTAAPASQLKVGQEARRPKIS